MILFGCGSQIYLTEFLARCAGIMTKIGILNNLVDYLCFAGIHPLRQYNLPYKDDSLGKFF